MADQWTPRVDARTGLAELLLEKTDAELEISGLLRADLERVRDPGLACRAADRAQKEEFAAIRSKVTGRSQEADAIEAREDALRDRLPLVIVDLIAAGSVELARWLTYLSFARFRMRELAPAAGSAEPAGDVAAEVKKVERVERGDLVSRFDGLEAFCRALLKPGREAIVERLEARKFGREALEALAVSAAAEAKLGRNSLASTAASAEESAQAKKQRAAWAAAKRAIRKACAGDAELKRRLGEC